MDDLISRKAAIDAVDRAVTKEAARWSLRELPAVESFTIEEMVMFINMVEMMRKECNKDFYYSPILSSVNRKVRDVFWNSSV